MPYDNIRDLPDSVRGNLPRHAQEIYKEAFNGAWDEYEDAAERRGNASREEVAHKVAWAAVKKKYVKDPKGEWKAKGDEDEQEAGHGSKASAGRGRGSEARRGADEERPQPGRADSKADKTGRSAERAERRASEGRNASRERTKAAKGGKQESRVTTDHDTIRSWIEARGGRPATVKATSGKGDPGLLRVDFPGYSGRKSLEPVAWEDFFRKFEEKSLAFLYQEETSKGGQSRFCKFIRRPAPRS